MSRNEYDFFKNRNNGRDCKSEQPQKTEKTKKKWIRCKEAIERYGVSRPTIMTWAVDSGALLKIDGTILIDTNVLENYIESFRVPGGVY